jgi:hypothetical protein
MLDFFPFPFRFHIEAVTLAGMGLWALGLYLGFFPIAEKITELLLRWFNFAERSLYTSAEEFERTRPAREAQNSFYASLFSIVPFLAVGLLCHYGLSVTLGRSWSISLGIIASMGFGIYELGRRTSESSDES